MHFRIAIDDSLVNPGSRYMIDDHGEKHMGIEIEQCEMIMKYLNYTYEYHHFDNDIGVVYENGTATGILGMIHRGEMDMFCARAIMSPIRTKYLRFTFPLQYETTQVFLIRNDLPINTSNFLFHPFSFQVWILVGASVFALWILYLVAKFMQFGRQLRKRELLNCLWSTIGVLSDIRYGENYALLSKFVSVRIFTVFWLLLWAHVFTDYYGSNLRNILIFSDKIRVPFEDFDGVLRALRSGSYRLLTHSLSAIPVCPKVDAPECAHIFKEIFARYPPVLDDYRMIGNDQFVQSHSTPLVTFAWLPGNRVKYMYNLWTELGYQTKVWAIRDSKIYPASLLINKRLPYEVRRSLDSAVVSLLKATESIDSHYSPSYPEVSLQQTPNKSSVTLRQLNSIFYILLGLNGLSIIIFLFEWRMYKPNQLYWFHNWSLKEKESPQLKRSYEMWRPKKFSIGQRK